MARTKVVIGASVSGAGSLAGERWGALFQAFSLVGGEQGAHLGDGDVLMGVGAAVAAGTGAESDGAGLLNPLLGGENEAVQSGLDSNSVEFDGIKTGVVRCSPCPTA